MILGRFWEISLIILIILVLTFSNFLFSIKSENIENDSIANASHFISWGTAHVGAIYDLKTLICLQFLVWPRITDNDSISETNVLSTLLIEPILKWCMQLIGLYFGLPF